MPRGRGLGKDLFFLQDKRIMRLYDPQDNGFEKNEDGEMVLKVKSLGVFLSLKRKNECVTG